MPAVCAALFAGCGPAEPTRRGRADRPPVRVDPLDLVDAYRLFPGVRAYDGIVVECPADQLAPAGTEAHWFRFKGARQPPPAVVFRFPGPCPPLPPGGSVVGTCRGAVRDGVPRGVRVDFVVVVEGCAVSPPP